uniref:Serine hydrolase domain-containing protein n=1 Tax=Heterosigma akashiwo TaxID=2829 RepID=A0A7S3UX78_HETAK
MQDFFFRPPSPSYDRNSFGGELCSLNGIDCLTLASVEHCSHIILYCHANSTDIGHCRKHLQALRSLLGVHVIGVEYPGYGTTYSSGKPSEDNINESVLKVYNFICKQMHWPPENIIVVGRSIGSGPATKLAREVPLGGLILISAFKSITSIARKFVGAGIANLVIANQYDNLTAIRQVHCPVLFLHGSEDDFVPFQHCQDLYNACASSRKTLAPLLGYGHNHFDWTVPIKRMDEFFVAHNVMSNRRTDLRRIKRMDEFFDTKNANSNRRDSQACEESKSAESETVASSWFDLLFHLKIPPYRELDKFLFEGEKIFDSQQFNGRSLLSVLSLPSSPRSSPRKKKIDLQREDSQNLPTGGHVGICIEKYEPLSSVDEAKMTQVVAAPASNGPSRTANPVVASQWNSRPQSNNRQPKRKGCAVCFLK